MLHDLEHVLAVEAARAGQATGEATTVLRALPAPALPCRGGCASRAVPWCSSLLVAAIAAVVIVLVAAGTHRTPPRAGAACRGGHRREAARHRGARRADDYDPYGKPDQSEHPADAPKAIDGNPDHGLDHRDLQRRPRTASPASASTWTPAARSPPAASTSRRIPFGYEARVYGPLRGTLPQNIDDWTPVSETATVGPRAEHPARHARAALPVLPGLDHEAAAGRARPAWPR